MKGNKSTNPIAVGDIVDPMILKTLPMKPQRVITNIHDRKITLYRKSS